MKKDLESKTALVTGASSGLGVAFARQLAARGANLVITARRKENLDALASELESEYAIDVHVIALDLSEPEAASKLFAETEGAGHVVDILINNAGRGMHKNFVEASWKLTAQQLQLNVISLTELSHAFANAMLKRGSGYILNVSSIGAYTPTATYATYSAGKAYVRDFTEALAYELRKTRIRVCCLCPGGTLTEFHQASGQTVPAIMRSTFMSAESCAKVGLSALFSGRRNVIAGWMNKWMMFLLRFLPRRFIVFAAAAAMGEPKLEIASSSKKMVA